MGWRGERTHPGFREAKRPGFPQIGGRRGGVREEENRRGGEGRGETGDVGPTCGEWVGGEERRAGGSWSGKRPGHPVLAWVGSG